MKHVFAFAILLITIQSCKSEPSSEELIDKFYSNQVYLDSFVKIIENDGHLESLFMIGSDNGIPDIEKSYPKAFVLLKKLNIDDAFSLPRICRKCQPPYYLKTNWSNKYPIYLIYDFRDSTENIKSFYEKDEYNNESWGLGNKWRMLRVVKLLEPGCYH